MTIAEVSQKFDISPDTLRYYERIGLIPPVPRTSSGIRDYDEVSCGWISLMKCMRQAGVQIEALIEYVSLFQQGDSTREARKRPVLSASRKNSRNIPLWILEKKRTVSILAETVRLNEQVI